MEDEKQLIEGCVRGEPWAQKKLYELHASAMMSVCQRYVPDRETAWDLLHDGFVRLFTKIDTYTGAGSFNGWMRKVFVTTVLEHLRRDDIMRYSADLNEDAFQVPDNDASPFERLSDDDLLECIANLPDGYRTIFNMHAIEGYTHGEIAVTLKINEGSSRSQYAKARRMLQKMVIELVEN
jgi:RNA polymerase sigma-70 factor (ECF subfamily)